MAQAPLNYKVNYKQRLPLDRCRWCKAAKPTLKAVNVEAPIKYNTFKYLCWATYRCSSCQNMILAHFEYNHNDSTIPEILQDDRVVENSLSFFPSDDTKLDNSIPTEIADLITEAMEIRQAPRSCVVACGTAVDAMLEINQIKKGSLNERIGDAAEHHLITEDMAKWAHHIRLERNDGTHKPLAPSPAIEEAKLCIDFTLALADILFVLPSKVTRGIQQAETNVSSAEQDSG